MKASSRILMRQRWCYHGVTMSDTTTLKLPRRLKTRISRPGRPAGCAPPAVVLAGREREIAREGLGREFGRGARGAGAAIEARAEVCRAEDVRAGLGRLAGGGKPRGPAPWRG